MSEHDPSTAEVAPVSGDTSGRASGPDPLEQMSADPKRAAQIDRALEDIALSSLRPITVAVAVLYALLVGAHYLSFGIDPEEADVFRVLGPLAGITAIVVFQLHRMVVAGKFAAEKAHGVIGGIALLVAANGAIQLLLTQQASHTMNLLVLIVGAGAVLLDRRWYGIVTFAAAAGWVAAWRGADPISVAAATAATTPTGDSAEVWNRYGIAVLGAGLVGYALMSVRTRTFRRIEAFHLRDLDRQDELEGALARTEAARQGEAEARGELEIAMAGLRESENRFRRLADASFEGILVHRNGEIRDANGQAGLLFGMSTTELNGTHIRDLFRCAQAEASGVELSELPDECEGVRTDGTLFPVEIANTSASVGGEEVTVTVVRDVTRQHEAERVLREAAAAAEESNRAKSTFLANMSHELRTPLNAVIGFSNILRKNKDGSFGDRDLEYLDRIVTNGKHLLALINDVLDLSKIEAGRMDVVIETVDLDQLAREMHRSFELQARRKGIDLILEVPARMAPIKGDGHRLKQILFNLVGNAMKFTDEGAVTVRVTLAEGTDEPARLDVQDSGIGIPEHRIREIFSPFQQVDASTSRKYGGTGLGLAISRSLCEMMGFLLTATSTEGEGSTFSIDMKPAEPVTPQFQPGSVTVADGS